MFGDKVSLDISIDYSKGNIEEISIEMLEQIEGLGGEEILKKYIDLYALKELINKVQDGMKEWAMEEAEKYSKEDNVIKGVRFERKNGRTMFDFSNDETCASLEQQLKDRKKMLKGLTEGMANSNRGEEAVPPMVSFTADTIAIRLPK